MQNFRLTKRVYSQKDKKIRKNFYQNQLQNIENHIDYSLLNWVKLLNFSEEPPCLIQLSHNLEKHTWWKLVDAYDWINFNDRYTAMLHKLFPISMYLNDSLEWKYTPMADFIHEIVWHIPALYNKRLSKLYHFFSIVYNKSTWKIKKDIIKLNRHTLEYGMINNRALWAVFLWSEHELKNIIKKKKSIKPWNIQEIISMKHHPFHISEIVFNYKSIDDMYNMIEKYLQKYI